MAIQFEEFKRVSPFWSWVIIIALSAAIILWGLVVYWAVKPQPRYWWHGEYPDTPAESIYSTVSPPKSANPTSQIAPLPEAKPLTRPGGGL